MQANYQYDYSQLDYTKSMYDREARERKANTMVKVLAEFYGAKKLKELKLLDIGSSTGIIDNYLANHFNQVTGIDIDEKAIKFAQQTFVKDNLLFQLDDAINLSFADNSFDIVICAQIYEHVPNAKKMLQEIYRVLNPNGVCYFAANNRLMIQEPHYNLPFLSILPKPLAHIYLKVTGKGKHYYETHYTYWSLKKLIQQFQWVDFTDALISQPEKYDTTYMVKPGSSKQRIAQFMLKNLYFLFPGYVWLLKKK